jgi:arylamine N-acetyltransferase
MSLLCELQERHLCHIPFENLSQHGAHGGPVALDIDAIAHKVLDRRRGGFCLELNSLFAALLRACGYQVTIVEAVVFKGTFDGVAPSHVCLMVKVPHDDEATDDALHYVDVGFGEPPLHPLKLDFHTEQVTPEGMRSRLMPDDDGNVVMEWWLGGSWMQRLRWKLEDAKGGESLWLPDMVPYLETVSHEESIFSKKLVVCRLFRDQKKTVAGSSYKITGAPRFSNSEANPVRVQRRESMDLKAIQDILWEQFAIPTEETATLDLEQSTKKENAEVWAQW